MARQLGASSGAYCGVMFRPRHASGPSLRRQAGVTLAEMMTVMAIVGILLAAGIPSYKYVTNSNRVSGEVNGLLGDLQFARGEAIKEGRTVSACVSSDGATCLGGASGLWNSGWIVFTDVNSTGLRDDPVNDTIWRTQATFPGTDTLIASGGVQSITFTREGFAATIPAGTLITLHTTPANIQWTRCLQINLVGLMNVLTNASNPVCS